MTRDTPSTSASTDRGSVTDTPRWRARYSGPGRSGVCRCGHHFSDHHLCCVMNQEYLDQTGESWIPDACLFYGCNEEEGLGPNGEPHCFNYRDSLDTST